MGIKEKYHEYELKLYGLVGELDVSIDEGGLTGPLLSKILSSFAEH